ncbi:MAG: ATP-binding cassette domain-containing protein [Alphaproteobacteria bacterium]|nr:ATP-binding cassette domain-containing protein [Alphaproteobacteria bacterium]
MDFDAPIYTITDAYLQFGARPLFSGLELYLAKGKRYCLVGRNGSGKSTLMKVVAGLQEADKAEIFMQPGTVVSYMAQEDGLSGFASLRSVILSGLPAERRQTEEYKADILIEKFHIAADADPKTASGGERKKAALARALINDPDILLLDEPTNHMDIAAIEQLEETLGSFSGALVVISHDKTFLKRVSDNIIWLDRGIVRTLNKGFDVFEDWQERVYEQEEIERHRLNKKIEAETEWLHKGVTARRKRNQGRLHKLYDLRNERREQIKKNGSVDLNIDQGEIKTNLIIEAKNISKAFGDRTIVSGFSLRLMRGNKIGIVGANGVGKTTLLRMLTGRLEPDTGFVRRTRNLQEVYFDQHRLALDPQSTVKETLCPDGGDHIFVGGEPKHVYSYMKDFLFEPMQANTPVSVLSGGEKNRLLLARELAKPSNFLVLDEPTNDLDMDTLDLLQEALANYKGTALIVSHDRDFLDNTATSLLYMAGDGSVVEYVDSCTNMLAKIKEKKEKAKPAVKTVEKKERPERSVPAQPRLSYKEKRLLELLPDEIAALEQKIKTLEAKLSEPDFYARSPSEFQQTAGDLEATKQLLDEKETKWLELNLRAEELT